MLGEGIRPTKWNAPIVEAPKGRRDEFVDPYFKGAKPDQVVVILKAREPARIMTAIGDKKLNRWHLQIADRWIVQYNLYVKALRNSGALSPSAETARPRRAEHRG